MNIFRKVFHNPKHKNEISFKANAYLKARNIRIGVLEPNVSNLLIVFTPENLENLYGPYKIFTDIVQENENNFVFLIGLLKNGKLVHLIPKNVSNEGDSNSIQFSTHNTDHEISQNKTLPRNNQNTTLWERLSKPSTRMLEDLNRRRTSKLQSEDITLTIDGNFVRQRMIKKNKKCDGQTVVKIIHDKNMHVNKIPWQYYTVSDAYLQGSRTYSIDDNNSMCSQDYAESTHVSGHVTSEDEILNVAADGDYLNNCLSDMKKVITGFIHELSPIDKKSSEIKNREEITETIEVVTTSLPKEDEIIVLLPEIRHPIIEKGDISENENHNTDISAMKHDTTSEEIKTENVQASEILISKQESDTLEEIINGKLSERSLTQTLYVFTESTHLSEQDNNNISQQKLHKVYENITEKKMEEIILSLIRNANMPVSIDILNKSPLPSNTSTLNLKYQQNELSNIEDISHGDSSVLDIEVQRLSSTIQEQPIDLTLPTDFNQPKQTTISNEISCGVQPMKDIELKKSSNIKTDKHVLPTISDSLIPVLKHNNSNSSLSLMDMEYLDVILNSICDSCEKMSINIPLSESSTSSVITDCSYVEDFLQEEILSSNDKVNTPKVDNNVNLQSLSVPQEVVKVVEKTKLESPISCQTLDMTYVVTPRGLHTILPISIIEGTEDIAKLAEEIVKRFNIDDSLSSTEINDQIFESFNKNICKITSSPLENDNTFYITANEENISLDEDTSESPDLILPLVDMAQKLTTHQENWTQTENVDIEIIEEDNSENQDMVTIKNIDMSGDFETVFNSVAVPKEWKTVSHIRENVEKLPSISDSGDNVLSISDIGENILESLNISDIVRESEKLLQSVQEDINKPSLDPPWWIRLSLPDNSSKKCKSIDEQTYRIKVTQSHASQRSRSSNVSSCISYQVRPKSSSENQNQQDAETWKKNPRSKFVVSDRLVRLSQPKVKRSPKKLNISKVSSK